MKKEFDFDDIGKRLPYAMPPDTFGNIRAGVLAAMDKDRRARSRRRIVRWSYIGGFAAAASVALLLIVTPSGTTQNDTLEQIDMAYSRLSQTDQQYLIEVYQSDCFLNQE